MRVLTVNPGSSSLKVSLLDPDGTVLADDAGAEHELAGLVGELPKPDAVGVRFVHGGTDFTEAVRVDAAVTARLRDLADLAPLHQPASLEALAAVTEALPGVPAVACFDTAFHATLPDEAATYALPGSGGSGSACAATASTGCRSPTPSAGRASCSGPTRRGSGWWCATSARARRSARSPAAGRWTPRWASRRWKAWSWRRGRAASTPASRCG